MSRFSEVTSPVAGPTSFARQDPAAVASQAAQILGLSAQLAGDPRFATEARAYSVRESGPDQEAIGDLRELGVPFVQPSSSRVDTATVRRRLARYRRVPFAQLDRLGDDERSKVFHALAEGAFEKPNAESCMALARACLMHPEALVRVAAAVAWFRNGSGPQTSLDVMVSALQEPDELVRLLAATALAQFSPSDPALRRLLRSRRPSETGPASHTATIVHGTWAADGSWWQPGDTFHAYLSKNVRPDMYSAADRFAWTGSYTDVARAKASINLKNWIAGRKLDGLDLLAHSHGGSVAMDATQIGAHLGDLVLLSCPAHEQKYLPDFAKVRTVWHVRVRMDLVVMLDGGGFRFQHPDIRDVRLPLWFDHAASHDPGTWSTHGVAARIGW